MGRVTLNDVGARAGVSRAAASLVVRGSTRITPATAARVRQAMDELGYVYDRRAAVLRSDRTMTLGIVVPEIRNPHLSELIMATEGILQEQGYTVLIGHSNDSAERERELLRAMVENHVDGILLQPAQDSDAVSVQSALGGGSSTPMVQVMRYLAGDGSYVGPDNFLAAELLGAHLRAIGVRSAVLVGGPRHSSARRERAAGLRVGLSDAVQLDVGEESATVTNYVAAGGRAMARVLDQGPLPDAVVGYSDIVTMGMYAELYARSITPGNHVAVASFDDTIMAPWLSPSLTSVATWPRDIAHAAARLLVKRIGDREAPHQTVRVEPSLRPRVSTLCWTPTEHPTV